MIKVGIVGGTGYTGAELLRLFAVHPHAQVVALTSRKEAGLRADRLFQNLRGHCDVVFSTPDEAKLDECDAVFFATPHGTAMQMAPALIEKGVKVIDLSADFRLKNAAEFRKWYGMEHTQPALLEEAVYGIPETHRVEIKHARLVANPGCHATAVQLGLVPLLEAGVIETHGIVADSKTGVSGAGRELKLGSMYAEVADSLKAYAVTGHRHQSEIDQELAIAAGEPVGVTFVPHLTPMIRGIHATIYARLTRPEVDLQKLFEHRYSGEPFIDVMPAGEHPETRSVRGGNQNRLAVHRAPDGKTVIVLSVIDNLVKGASGQALQCFNLMFDLPEDAGLQAPGLLP